MNASSNAKTQTGRGDHHPTTGRRVPTTGKGMTLEQFRAQLRERRDALNPEVTK